jgi:hypothetical protein
VQRGAVAPYREGIALTATAVVTLTKLIGGPITAAARR